MSMATLGQAKKAGTWHVLVPFKRVTLCGQKVFGRSRTTVTIMADRVSPERVCKRCVKKLHGTSR